MASFGAAHSLGRPKGAPELHEKKWKERLGGSSVVRTHATNHVAPQTLHIIISLSPHIELRTARTAPPQACQGEMGDMGQTQCPTPYKKNKRWDMSPGLESRFWAWFYFAFKKPQPVLKRKLNRFCKQKAQIPSPPPNDPQSTVRSDHSDLRCL